MSHISTYSEVITNIELLKKVAKEKGYEVRENVNVRLYGRNEIAKSTGIKIPGWNYEIAIDEKGEVKYDFFGSDRTAGTFEKLGLLIRDYSIAAIEEEIDFNKVMQKEMFDLEDEGKEMILTLYDE